MTRKALTSELDTDKKIRAELLKRIERAIRRPSIPVAVLYQVAQCIEMWED